MGEVMNWKDCPTRSRKFFNCRCQVCAVCDGRKHTSIHGGTMGDEQTLWKAGHYFEPRDEAPVYSYARCCGFRCNA